MASRETMALDGARFLTLLSALLLRHSSSGRSRVSSVVLARLVLAEGAGGADNLVATLRTERSDGPAGGPSFGPLLLAIAALAVSTAAPLGTACGWRLGAKTRKMDESTQTEAGGPAYWERSADALREECVRHGLCPLLAGILAGIFYFLHPLLS